MKMKCIKSENGAIMVEATIYMPLVLCTVMALLYLALFNMQEYLLIFTSLPSSRNPIFSNSSRV